VTLALTIITGTDTWLYVSPVEEFF